jgi:hypothetical protein
VALLNHPLDGNTFSLSQRKLAYAVDYHATSQYVHCSERGLVNYFHDPARIFAIAAHGGALDNALPKALFITCIYLHSILCYALFGMKVDRPQELNEHLASVIEKLKPIASQIGKAY